jgi:hypothetical protein
LRTRTILLAALIGLAAATSVAAQQRPLVTEDPETIGSGLMLIEGGFDYASDAPFPVSGLQGNLVQAPSLGISFGVSSIAEIQVDGLGFQHLSINSRRPAPLSHLLDVTGDSTGDLQDIVVGTKVRLVAEGPGHPAVGLRFATRLPVASNESGLGLDTTDFYVTGLIGKTTQSVRIVGNFGVGILADPTDGNRQNDVFLYGASIARAVQQGVEIVGEINGRLNTRDEDVLPGTESRATVRIGGRVTTGTVRLDGAVLFGTTARDPGFGFTVGATWVFRGFTVP